MSRTQSPQAAHVAGALALALAVAVGTAMSLAALSKPAQFQPRIAALRQSASETKALLAAGATPDIAASAECPTPSSAISERWARQIATLAAARRMAPPQLDIRPAPAPPHGDGLSAFEVRLATSGPYDGALGVLAGLAGQRPTLFIDTADLKGRISDVTLAIRGHVYCASPR